MSTENPNPEIQVEVDDYIPDGRLNKLKQDFYRSKLFPLTIIALNIALLNDDPKNCLRTALNLAAATGLATLGIVKYSDWRSSVSTSNNIHEQ